MPVFKDEKTNKWYAMVRYTDWQGERRVRQVFDETTPRSYNGRRNTSAAFKWIAETVNDLSGGNKLRRGRIDMAPEDVQLILETIAGGLGRDIAGAMNTYSNVKEISEGGSAEKLFRQMPVVKSFVREYPESTSRYYEAVDAYNADKAEFKKTTEMKRRRDMGREKPYLRHGGVDELIGRVNELRHLERGEVKVGRKWVERKNPVTEERKRRFHDQRLAAQARVLKILGR